MTEVGVDEVKEAVSKAINENEEAKKREQEMEGLKQKVAEMEQELEKRDVNSQDPEIQKVKEDLGKLRQHINTHGHDVSWNPGQILNDITSNPELRAELKQAIDKAEGEQELSQEELEDQMDYGEYVDSLKQKREEKKGTDPFLSMGEMRKLKSK